MSYLKIPKGAFFVSKNVDEDQAFIAKKTAEMSIGFAHLGDFSASSRCLQGCRLPAIHDPAMVDVWRLWSWIERSLVAYARHYGKSNAENQGAAAIWRTLHFVNNGVFFTPSVQRRLRVLYDATKLIRSFRWASRLNLRVEPTTHRPSIHQPDDQRRNEGGDLSAPTCSLYAEHRARLAILKTAIDHELAIASGGVKPRSSPSWECP